MAVVCGGAENKSNIVALVVGQWTRVGIFSCVACKKKQIHKTLGSVRHSKCYGNHTNRFQKLFICFIFFFPSPRSSRGTRRFHQQKDSAEKEKKLSRGGLTQLVADKARTSAESRPSPSLASSFLANSLSVFIYLFPPPHSFHTPPFSDCATQRRARMIAVHSIHTCLFASYTVCNYRRGL